MNTKTHILNTAESLFNIHGYNSVGVDLIRDEAGVSKTSMYRHFGSKHKLIEAVLIRRHARFEEKLGGGISAENSIQENLDLFIDWHFDWFAKDDFYGCMFIHAMAEFKESNPEITTLAFMHKKWLKELIYKIIAANTKLTEQQIQLNTEMVMTFLEGMIVRAEFGENTSVNEEYRQAIKSLSYCEQEF